MSQMVLFNVPYGEKSPPSVTNPVKFALVGVFFFTSTATIAGVPPRGDDTQRGLNSRGSVWVEALPTANTKSGRDASDGWLQRADCKSQAAPLFSTTRTLGSLCSGFTNRLKQQNRLRSMFQKTLEFSNKFVALLWRFCPSPIHLPAQPFL